MDNFKLGFVLLMLLGVISSVSTNDSYWQSIGQIAASYTPECIGDYQYMGYKVCLVDEIYTFEDKSFIGGTVHIVDGKPLIIVSIRAHVIRNIKHEYCHVMQYEKDGRFIVDWKHEEECRRFSP